MTATESFCHDASVMFARIRKLLDMGASDASPTPSPDDELRMASACILVEAALVDGHVDEREMQHIHDVLEEHFGLGTGEVQILVDEATRVAGDAVCWHRFTRVLKAEFDAAERLTMMQQLWQVVLADGELHAYEDSLVRRIAGLLHIDDGDRALARRRAQARLARLESSPPT